jgi:hypothetical protein
MRNKHEEMETIDKAQELLKTLRDGLKDGEPGGALLALARDAIAELETVEK